MGEKPTVESLLNSMVPVEKRSWYPWTWPDKTQLERMKEKEKAAFWQRTAEIAREDLFFFADEVLRDSGHMPLHKGLHDEICWLLQAPTDIGILVPRNTLKSTLASEAYPLWLMARDPNITILLASDVQKIAMNFCRYIEEQILNNERLHKLFPDLRPALSERGGGNRYKNWNRHEFQVMRTRILTSATMTTMGMDGQTLTGFHGNIGIYDDIVTKDNANSTEKIKQVTENFRWSSNLLDMGAWKRLIGTRYHELDIYNEEMEKGDMPFYIREAIEDGKYCWPVEPYVLRVEEKRKELPARMFASQYMNRIVAEGDSEFDEKWLNYWTIDTVRKEMGENAPQSDDDLLSKWYSTLNIYLGCDPARSDKKKSDFTVMLVCGMDSRERLFLLDMLRKHLKTPDIVTEFITMFKKWNPHGAKIETYGGDVHVYNDIRRTMKDLGLPYFRVGEYAKTSHMSGDDRIRLLQTPASRGKIWLTERPEHLDLKYEILHFPYAKHDDLITTLAYLYSQQAKKRPEEMAKPVQGTSFDRYVGRSRHQGNWMTA